MTVVYWFVITVLAGVAHWLWCRLRDERRVAAYYRGLCSVCEEDSTVTSAHGVRFEPRTLEEEYSILVTLSEIEQL